MFFARPLLLAATLSLAACVQVQSNVTRFHEDFPTVGKRFVMVTTAQQDTSLEYKSYAEKVGQRLQSYGMKPAQNADYGVTLNFAVDGGHEVISSTPVYGPAGGGTVFESGTIRTTDELGHVVKGKYKGQKYIAPSYGVVGTDVSSSTVYNRTLEMKISDQKTHQTVFEGKVESAGGEKTFAAVADCLIAAMFQNFPGQSGQTQSVILDADECGVK